MPFLNFHAFSYISATVHHTNPYITLGWPVSRRAKFCSLLTQFFWGISVQFLLSVVLFHVVLQINSIFNVSATSRTFVDITNTEIFSDKSRREKMAFLRSPARLTSRRPSPTPESVRTAFARSLVRWRHNQIFSGWWVTNFHYPWCLAAAPLLSLTSRRHHQNQQLNQANQLNMERYKKTVRAAIWLQLTVVACYLPSALALALIAKSG